jgi:hypothetical protein
MLYLKRPSKDIHSYYHSNYIEQVSSLLVIYHSFLLHPFKSYLLSLYVTRTSNSTTASIYTTHVLEGFIKLISL